VHCNTKCMTSQTFMPRFLFFFKELLFHDSFLKSLLFEDSVALNRINITALFKNIQLSQY
jgi:hypothetical protein